MTFPVKVANLAKDDALKEITKAISTRLFSLYGHKELAADKAAHTFLERACCGETPWSVEP